VKCTTSQTLQLVHNYNNETFPRLTVTADAIGEFLLTLTSAPMTPRLVSRRYSKGRVLLVVWRKG